MVENRRFALGRVGGELTSFPAKHVCPTDVSPVRGSLRTRLLAVSKRSKLAALQRRRQPHVRDH